MKNRVLLSSLAAVAGLAAAANAQTTTGSSSVTATTVLMGDTGDNDGLIEPGEAAIVGINIAWTGRNTTGSFNPANNGNTTGTIRGLGGGFIDLVGTGGTAGVWTFDVNNGSFIADPLFDVGPAGWGTPTGTGLANIQFAQLPSSPAGINTTGPFTPMWYGLWTPASYADRFVTFNTQSALAAGGNPFSVLFKVGVAPNQVTVSAFTLQNSFVASGGIHVIPAPSSLALLGLGGLIAGRRRRR